MATQFVTLVHSKLKTETRQPLSVARVLLDSGWQPKTSADKTLLGLAKQQASTTKKES